MIPAKPFQDLPALLLATLLLMPLPAAAQTDHPLLTRQHSLALGGVAQSVDADLVAQRGSFVSPGVELDQIGLDDRDTSVFLDYGLRFGDRWSLALSAYQWRNDGGRVVGDTFDFDGVEYAAGVAINSRLDLDTYIATVMYSVYQTDRAEISLGAGLHMFDTEVAIAASAGIADTAVVAGDSSFSELLAPLPNLRGRAIYAFSDRWAVAAETGWLSANIDEYSGDFIYAQLSLEYQMTERWGLSAGYQFVDLDIEETLDNGLNVFDMTVDGVSLAVRFSF